MIFRCLSIPFFFFLVTACLAQSLSGTYGLVRAPSAEMNPDRTFVLRATYIPVGFHQRTYGASQGQITPNPSSSTFVSLTLFPRLEVMFRYTHEFNLRVNPNTGYFPDRMFSIRWQIRKESSKFPAVLLGLQDVSAAFDLSCKSCANFSATYVVTTKKFKTNLFTIHLSAGYAFDFNGLVARDYKGVFWRN